MGKNDDASLSTTRAVFLPKDNQLQLVVASKHTGTSYSTEDVCTSTLEQGLGSLVLQNLGESVQRALVLDSFSGGHHHSSPYRVNRIRCKASSVGDQPTQSKARKETILQSV
ncbi:unnamed protein product [Musa acuminata subsp. burmannicoides]